MEYFTNLGVTQNSNKAEIAKAYRRLALKYHPDKNNDNVDNEHKQRIFAEILNAYNLLISNKKISKVKLTFTYDDISKIVYKFKNNEIHLLPFNDKIYTEDYDITINVLESSSTVYKIVNNFIIKTVSIDLIDYLKRSSINVEHINRKIYSISPSENRYIEINIPILVDSIYNLKVKFEIIYPTSILKNIMITN